MGSVAPDQGVRNAHRWGARLDQHNKREPGYASGGSSAPTNRSDTTRHPTGQMPVTALLTEAR